MLRTLILGSVLLCACDRVFGVPPPEDASGPDDGSIADVAADARAAWWNEAWRRRHALTIDTSKLVGPVTNFPILVRLTPAMFDYAAAAASGADLRFVTEDGSTELAHEIETFQAGGETAVWVRIPSMMPGGANPRLWLYYANPTATSTSDGAPVFADTHVSVHHLGPDGFADATGHGHAGTPAGADSTPSDATGIVARARTFDGNDVVTLAGEPAYDLAVSLSASAWIRVVTFDTQFQTILAKGNTAWRVHRHNDANVASFGTTSGTVNQDTAGTIRLDDGAWHHVAVVLSSASKQIYIDGLFERSSAGAIIDTNNIAVTIGANLESTIGGQRHWKGVIDEVRVSASARTFAWFSAEHTTVRDPTFVTVGPEDRF